MQPYKDGLGSTGSPLPWKVTTFFWGGRLWVPLKTSWIRNFLHALPIDRRLIFDFFRIVKKCVWATYHQYMVFTYIWLKSMVNVGNIYHTWMLQGVSHSRQPFIVKSACFAFVGQFSGQPPGVITPCNYGVHHKHRKLHWKNRAPKDSQVASPLVMQGFSNFLGLFQVIMANPEL